MSRRILLADDSVTIQKVIELTFMDDDYEVRAVGNGDEALAMLAALQVDFVIADVHMPGATGYEVCRRSKELRPEVPVLLLVGTFEPFDEAQARAAGADSFLKKPFDSQELLGRVHDLLSAAPATEEAAPEAPAATPATPAIPATPASAPPAVASPAAAGPAHSTSPPVIGGAFPAAPASAAIVPPAPASPEPWAPPAPTTGQAPETLAAAAPATAPGTPPPPVHDDLSVETAASWQAFELEAEPEFIPDPWDERATAAAETAAHQPVDFEQPFALGDLEEPEPASAAAPLGHAAGPGAAGFAPPAAPAAPIPDASTGVIGQPFTLGEPLDERHRFGAGSSELDTGRSERPTVAEPVIPFGAPPAPPAGATIEERAGAPLGESPFTSSLTETEERIAEHAGHPAFAEGGPHAATATAPAPAAQGAESAAAAWPGAASGGAAAGSLNDSEVERIARRVVELIGERVVRDVAWEVIPDLAEVVIKDRLRELESQVE